MLHAPYIYEALIAWLQAKGYITPDTPVVRPFWSEGDFTDLEQYPPGAVVVDNPPFSIMSSILRFYEQHNITFFLFAPSLTSFSYMSDAYDLTAIILNLSVVYENGAKISTAFVTNLHRFDPVKAMTAPDLYQMLDNAQKENRKEEREKVHTPRLRLSRQRRYGRAAAQNSPRRHLPIAKKRSGLRS